MSVPITRRILVSDLEASLAAYDRIKVYRATTEAGDYIEVSTVATRPALRSGASTYIFLDPVSEPSFWYKTSLFHSVTLAESDLSSAQQARHPALDVLSVEELQLYYLTGVALQDRRGNVIPSAFFEHHIRAAVAAVEFYLDVALTLREVNEKQDFDRLAYAAWLTFQLRMLPVSDLTEVKLVLPAASESTTESIYDPSAFRVFEAAGQVNIIPGGVLLIGNVTLQQMLLGYTDRLPQVFYIRYTAGFDIVPDDLRALVGQMAAISLLPQLGNLVFGPGVVSKKVTVDSLMTDVRTAQGTLGGAYGGLIREYKAAVADALPRLRKKYHGINFGVL